MSGGDAALFPPVALAADHRLDAFDSGVAPLDDWLKQRARHNEAEGGSRSFVVCAGHRVVAYYSLAASPVSAAVATGRVRRNMPNPVPVVVLGRLAVDRGWQGRGLGADLLRDAVLRVSAAGVAIGVRAILVHAISNEAKAFYERHGFRPSTMEPMILMVILAEARRALLGGG